MSDKMITCLWFDQGEARNAAEFYASIFPDSQVGTAMAAPSDFPGGERGTSSPSISPSSAATSSA